MSQPLPPQQRTQVQTTVTGIVYPLAIGATGLVLLLFIDVLGFDPVQLAGVLLVVLVAWLTTSLVLGREYPKRLQQALRHRTPGWFFVAPAGPLDSHRAGAGADQPQAGAVLYALDVLESVTPDEMPRLVPPLLEHRHPAVRLDALGRIERLAIREALPQVPNVSGDPSYTHFCGMG